MTGEPRYGAEPPDPSRIVTRRDFAGELTRLRELAGLTVRDVAKATGLPVGTMGDYFAGRHLPPLRPARLPGILRACGVTDSESVARWSEALRRVRRSPGRRTAETRAPYLGLASFQPEDAEWFFGRDALTATLVARVLEGRAADGILAVTGPSGSGKSSLLRAGLIPALHGPSLLLTPGADPLGELAARLADLAGRTDEVVDGVRGDPARAADLAEQAVSASATGEAGGRLVVIVDQFEEVFTDGCTDTERVAFLTALQAVARTSALVVIGLRADFYARALRHRELARILQTAQVVVGPMSETELRRAIVGPAQKAGLTLEDGLADLLLQDLRASAHDQGSEAAHDAGALPLLSHALLATWLRRHRRGLTIADYQDSGGIAGAVARTAESAYAGLSSAQQRIARQIFLRLVHIADDTGDTRRRVTLGQLPPGDEVIEVLDHFIDQRLITVATDEFDLVHEALLAAWPRLRAWLDADRVGLRTHRRLSFAAEVWRESRQDPSTLLRTVRLAEAAEWAEDTRHAADLNALEREFLAASLDHERAEQRSARSRSRHRQELLAVLLGLSLVASVLAVVAFRQRVHADEERDVAISRRVAVEADKLRAKDVDLAGQLSLAAYRVAPTREARSSLLESSSGPSVTRVLGSPGVLQTVAFTRDGHRMATGGTDRTVRLWNLADRSRPTPVGRPLQGPETVFSVAFSPDGRLLVGGGGGGVVRLWRLDGDTVRDGGLLAGARDTVYSVAFSPDGRTLALGSADRTVGLWDLSDPARPVPLGRRLAGPGGAVQSVAFSPDGRTLAAGSAGGSVRLWRLGARPRPLGAALKVSAKSVFSVAFSPDGHTLAAGGADDTVRLLNLTGRRPVPLGRPFTGPKGWVNSVAFAPGGATLAAAASDGELWIWDVATHAHATSLPHPGPVTAVVFLGAGSLATSAADGAARIWDLPGPVVQAESGDIFSTTVSSRGHLLATASSVGTAQLWSLADPRHPLPLGPAIHDAVRVGHASGASGLSPDGRTLAIGGIEGGSQLWNVADPAHPAPLPTRLTGPAGIIQGFAFRPDGRLVAAAGNDKKVWLWDISDPRHPVRTGPPLTGPSNYAYAPAFSPDGRTLAAGSADSHVYLWDVADPRHPAPLGRPLTGHSRYVFTTAFSPDGRTMATGSADNKVLLWDVTDRRHPRALPVQLTGPDNYVWSVVFDGTGRLLAATAGDGTAWLWNVSDPRHPRALATLSGSADALYTDVFDTGRPILVTAGVGATVHLWNTDAGQAETELCAVAGTPITRAEWHHYLPDRPYRPPCGTR
ncbi:WD40 repeat protein [Actinoallomurus bryophytorum]|uniref:WD40 repeat protein n=1 Tax=Actinoallomurus bryophytorum TaxID=1490222 RepID=A0A543CPT6_9ACTN|nr:helix-turn-helix domain-containing protein [Actinoallomurus bryophytorum]TQL99099.1 WD40 repeat protein [Actinoallomurus bryophytorum]